MAVGMADNTAADGTAGKAVARNTGGSPFVATLPGLAESFGLEEAEDAGEELYRRYRARLKEAALLDFDDLCAGAVRLLAGNPAILEGYRTRYRHILVDEYQDINFAQYALIRLLAPSQEECDGTDPPELRVIGDPNQAIYGFRGSDKRFIDRFALDYPQARRFYLGRSFRCAAPNIDAAGRLTGSALRGVEAPVSLYRTEYPTEKSEAEGIARRIARLIGGTSFFALDSGAALPAEGDTEEAAPGELKSLGDCAVLVRTAALAAPVAKALRDHGLPFDLIREQPWWEEEPVRSLVEELRASLKTAPAEVASSTTASSTAPSTPAAPAEVASSTTAAPAAPAPARRQSPAEAASEAWERMLQRTSEGKPKKAGRNKGKTAEELGELRERFLTLAGIYDDLGEFLDILAVSGGDGLPRVSPGSRPEGVRLMTIHASKGLEFDHVFVAALEEGLLPFTRYEKDHLPETIEEEQRLLYVAMTRARQGLYLSWTRSRKLEGRPMQNRPSRFLEKLEELIPLERERRLPPRDLQPRLF
jgi:superfamily I DNA/RNA helicase